MKLPELARFIVVGLLSTVTHFTVLTMLYKKFGVGIVVASVLAFGCSLVVSYLCNRSFTFRSDIPHQYGAPKYILVTLSGLLWNVSILYFMTEVFFINYFMSFLCMSVVVALNNYLLSKQWVFDAGRIDDAD